MVTRIIARLEGYAGRYVWHCHILEHEDNEMMRPYEVLPAGAPPTHS
jgi:spore coat protein A, manganese oxidase